MITRVVTPSSQLVSAHYHREILISQCLCWKAGPSLFLSVMHFLVEMALI